MKTLLFIAALLPLAAHAELELKTMADKADGAMKKKPYGPYIGVYAGESFGQSGNVSAGNRAFTMNSEGGSAIFGIEVGKSWRMKRVPLQFSLDFEGTYQSTEIRGESGDARLANGAGRLGTDLVGYTTDMNSLMFTLNASFAVDLHRYRARIGKVLAGFKPYIGGGFGGGQVWYRNARGFSRDQLRGVNQNTAASQSIFAIDEFVNSWNWYGGLEWSWEDKYSIFAEYRDTKFGDLDNLASYQTDGYVLGFRYRY